MPSLLSTEEVNSLTGIFNDIFDTFKRQIVIHKEPIKTISQSSPVGLFGYGDPSNEINYTYSPVSGVYEANVKYIHGASSTELSEELNSKVEGTVARIKVKSDAKDFINNGKTEKIEIDGRTCIPISNDITKKFLSSEFFIYYLKVVD